MKKSFSATRKKTLKYINTNTKKSYKISYQNFQKLFHDGELKWVDEKFEFSLFMVN